MIENELIEQYDPVFQNCDYCGQLGTLCIEPARLAQWFTSLIATYEEDDQGESLVAHLKNEWGMFSDSRLSPAGAKELLGDVLDDGNIVRRLFRPIIHPDGGHLRHWEELRDELMHSNRWFLAEPMEMDRIGGLLSQLITTPASLGTLPWYRARLMSSDEPFSLNDMGAPPPHLAGHGRANPAGIPYLYLGSTRATAVAELRPHTGERACIARFDLNNARDLKFADLRDPRSLISPLLVAENEIIELRADLPLLERLGQELTRPVLPRGVAYEYVPTQYLCEYIKSQGFDGVLYSSSVSSDGGVNVALFDPTQALAVSVEEALVSRVSVEISR